MELEPFNQGYLKVSELHTIYFHEYGNPDGQPVVAPHGGPGSSSKEKYANLYSLEKFRVILYDQRGCGKSTPTSELLENTTADLVEDIEKLRKHLKIEKWYMHGPSWGSTLTLLYAQQYPDRVEKIVLRGIFFASKSEAKWSFEFGANQVFPDKWDKFISQIPENKRNNYLNYLYEVALGDDTELQNNLLPKYNQWEGSLLSLEGMPEEEIDVEKEVQSARIMLHYVVNDFFLEKDQILKNLDKIKHIPMVIINGRYDMITPMVSAWTLHKALPNSILDIVTLAGHHGSEPELEKVIKNSLKFDW